MLFTATDGDSQTNIRVRWGISARKTALMLSALFFFLTFAVLAFRLMEAPDLFADEALYASVGNNIAAGRGMTENSGKFFVWHPPVYMLVEAGYLKAINLVDAEPATIILHLRYINAVAAAITVVLLFQIGRMMRGMMCGSMIAFLYCQDPYIQRIGRRSMLEVLAAMLLVLGFWLYMRGLHRSEGWVRQSLLCGVAIGLAALTKEILMVGLVVIFLFVMFYRRDQITRLLVITAATCGTYSVYPIWIALSGYWPDYSAMKGGQLFRLVARLAPQPQGAAVTPTKPTLSGSSVSLWENLNVTLRPYIFSYLLIGMGGLVVFVVVIMMLRRSRVSQEQAFITFWGIVWYGFIGSMTVFGQSGDQFFYYIIVPAIVLIGWVMSPLFEYLGSLWSRRSFSLSWQTGMTMVCVVLIGLILSWNITIYVQMFATGDDDGYAVLSAYVKTRIPPGTTLIAGNELALYLFPEYNVRFDRSEQDVRDQNARYIILSTKERWGGYNKVTHEFYDWVAANSTVQFQQYGATYWDLRLFELAPRT